MAVKKRGSSVALALGLFGATLALAIAALIPPKAEAAFATFSGGVLTVRSSEEGSSLAAGATVKSPSAGLSPRAEATAETCDESTPHPL